MSIIVGRRRRQEAEKHHAQITASVLTTVTETFELLDLDNAVQDPA